MPKERVVRWARLGAPYVVAAATPDLPGSVVLSPQPPAAYKTAHEPGGTDALTALANSSIAPAAAIAESKLALSFPTHANSNDPTADQKAALAGTDGAPSGANPYVTDSDPRLGGGVLSGTVTIFFTDGDNLIRWPVVDANVTAASKIIGSFRYGGITPDSGDNAMTVFAHRISAIVDGGFDVVLARLGGGVLDPPDLLNGEVGVFFDYIII